MGVYIFSVIVSLALTGGFGAWLAGKKDYSPVLWFFICFFTGPIGLIAIAGAPAQGVEYLLEEINRKLTARPSEAPRNPTPSAAPRDTPLLSTTAASVDTWFCRKCQTKNLMTASSCKGCGAYR